jgi:hypothetical protein
MLISEIVKQAKHAEIVKPVKHAEIVKQVKHAEIGEQVEHAEINKNAHLFRHDTPGKHSFLKHLHHYSKS